MIRARGPRAGFFRPAGPWAGVIRPSGPWAGVIRPGGPWPGVTLSGARRAGFTLLEVLVALTLGALVALLMARVLETATLTSEGVASSVDDSRRILTLRRVLHRDVQGIVWGQPVISTERSLSFTTTHNHLHTGALEVAVVWTTENGTLTRMESNIDMQYHREMPMWTRSNISMKVDVYDNSRNTWTPGATVLRRISLENAMLDQEAVEPPLALRVLFTPAQEPRAAFTGASSWLAPGMPQGGLLCIERIPRALLPSSGS